MAYIGTDVSNEVLAILQDTTNVHTNPADVLVWLNAGIREVVALKPKAGTATQNIDLAAGATKQAVPAGVIQLLDVTTNMGADGNTPGRNITVITIDRMNAAKANWRRETGPQVKHVMFDDRDNTVFYVWPAPAAATKAEARVLKLPTPVAAIGDAVPLDDSYRNALVHFVLFKANSQDASHASNMEQAMANYAAFANSLGLSIKGQKKAGPTTNSPTNPASPAVEKNGA